MEGIKMAENLFPIMTKNFSISPKNEKNLLKEGWNISSKNGENTNIGNIEFEDGIYHGEIKIAVDLNPEYDKIKFVEEIFYAMARFVFRFKEIREISTVCRHENENRVKGLEKAGYVRRETTDGNDHYSMKKQNTSWTGLYIFIGLIAGFIIGLVVSNLWMGTIGGVLIGALLGYLMDKRDSGESVGRG